MSHIAIFENERATGYDDFVKVWIPNYQFFIDLLPLVLEDAPSKKLLVAGCGTGNEIHAFQKSAMNWSITGVDPSPDMITLARKKLANNPQVSLVDGDVASLSPKSHFGAATLILVLHFIKDNETKRKLLKEIASRLEPGSPFVLMGIFGDTRQIEKNLKVLSYLIPNTIQEEIIQSRLERLKNEFHHISEKKLEELLISAGFEPPVRFYHMAIYSGWLTRKSTKC